MTATTDPARRRLWLAGATLTTGVAVVSAVIGLRTTPAAAKPSPAMQPKAIPVMVATVVRSNATPWEEFSGHLEAVDRVEVRPRVAGTIDRVHFREGALVRAGDPLFTIDQAPFHAAVDRAAAQVVAAQARLNQARTDSERDRRLLEDHAVSQRDYDQATNTLNEADANLRAAHAALTTAKLDLGYTEVRAPVAGRIGKIEITTGNLVAAGPTAPVLTRLVSVNPIYASFDADESVVLKALHDLPGHGDGKHAAIEQIPVQLGTVADTGTPVSGHLQLVDNQVDGRSGTVRVRAVFDNADGSLIPGQFARLRMGQIKPQPALLVSERAIGTDQDKKYVIVVGTDNKVSYRPVKLGAHVDDLRIVTSGLEAGERIVVSGVQRVRPGALVVPEEVQMDQVAQTAAGPGATPH
jgi:multidrug efflux system membrane fusion protein